MTERELFTMPKVDLHCHLDGSLSLPFVQGILGEEITLPMLQAEPDCASLEEYLEKFALPLQCLQTREHLSAAAYDLIRSAAREHVCYLEVRFAPLLSTQEGLSVAEVLSSVREGLARGERDYGVASAMIVCAMRHHTREQNEQMLEASAPFLGQGVCAADLAGDEAHHPMKEFTYLMETATRLGIPTTIHAGETGNAQNIEDAIRLGARRIGHGIAMRGDAALQQLCAERGIGIEVCPLSNLQTKAVGAGEYPIHEFLDAGILVTVNTDNRTVSRTTLTKELLFLQEKYGIDDDTIRQMMRNAVQVSFAGEALKKRLEQQIENRDCLAV